MLDLERYLQEIIRPTVADFEAEPLSRRRLFLACVVIAHAVDYLEHPKRPRSRRDKLKRQSEDFRRIDRIAHAFKHVESDGLDRLNEREVIPRPPASWGVAAWDVSRWDDPVGGVTLEKNTGVDLLTSVRGAVSFLEQIIEQEKSS